MYQYLSGTRGHLTNLLSNTLSKQEAKFKKFGGNYNFDSVFVGRAKKFGIYNHHTVKIALVKVEDFPVFVPFVSG